ncbi:transporter substrate-binding domain-containing protein [Erwinia sp. V71]|uniref:transporter substrate-binding domain-containing protein n=1 Tax=Erwinia sp. V71 TaxID=3369424 RepID=UPI003F627AB4
MRVAFALVLLVAAGSASAQSHLNSVMQQGTLAVCTTGDYKPYSFQKPDGSYEGIDISMAESLASSLGAKVQWVKSSWKTLTPDLVAGKCDIAVGGISVTLARQKQVFFTEKMDVDGKIPLVRCSDVSKYQTIEQINKPSVRLIEPAGGTNEAFAHAYLPQSNLTLSHDNQGIFQQLVDNKADVMITEASEALYQKNFHPTLCAVNPDKPMQYGEKAYMLPGEDISWKLYVDQWLHLAKATGEYQKIADHWLSAKK